MEKCKSVPKTGSFFSSKTQIPAQGLIERGFLHLLLARGMPRIGSLGLGRGSR